MSKERDLFGERTPKTPERIRRYVQRNREKIRVRSKLFRENNLIKERERQLRHYRENRSTFRVKRQKIWYGLTKEEREKRYVVHRRWRRKNPDKIIGYRLKHKYGVLIVDFPKPDACPCCGQQAKLVFDHCHQTGKPRGWLCERCNKLLGWANDEIWRLEALIQYVRKHHPER